MSTDKFAPNKNNNKKKRNAEIEIKVDPATLEMLSKTFISPIKKVSNKFPKAKFHCKICPYHMDDTDRAVKHSVDSMHQKNLQKIYNQNLLKYLPKPMINQLEVINECLNDTLKLDIFISEVEADRRRAICEQMNVVAEQINGKLNICGSLSTGLSIAGFSDVNLYLEVTSTGASYLDNLKQLSTLISEKLNMKTDIKQDKDNCGLFVVDSTGLSYHISSSTRVCHMTSECMAVYLKIDLRAEILVRLFRYFANQSFIDRYRDGLFPSQVFTIMVVFYLQTLAKAPILPNLHKLADLHPNLPDSAVTVVSLYDTMVRYVSDLDTIKSIWNPPKNELSLAELWIGLLRFYTVDFDSTNFMVSVRCNEPVLKIDRNIVNKRLAVEDPFDFKRNLLFGWNSPDVIDFLNDQMQNCYTYFAVPQLVTGPAFTKVDFSEISLESMESKCLVTPTFTKDSFTSTIDFLEAEFKKVYDKKSATYDVTKWPLSLFVKSSLSRILTAIFDSKQDIDIFISFLEFKQSSYFHIPNYSTFKALAVQLSMCILNDFSTFFNSKNSWIEAQMGSKDAYNVIKKSVQKFLNESKNQTINDDDCNETEFEMNDMDNNEDEADNHIGDLGVTAEDSNDEQDMKVADDDANKTKTTEIVKNVDIDSWKIPIAFKFTHAITNGVLRNGNEPEVYNLYRVQNIKKKDLSYSFFKMDIHKSKLVITCSLCNMKGHRKECCLDAIPHFEELRHVLRDVDSMWLMKLRSVLTKKFENTRPSKELNSAYDNIFVEVNNILKKIYPTVRPQMFGSSHNGFMTQVSDIDICLEFYVDEKRQHLSNKEIVKRLRKIGSELRKNFRNIDVMYILRAKVPIVKFYLYDGTQGDISINNSLAIQNTRMIKVYSDIFPDMKVLGNLIKFVAKSCDIGDASQGTLSSYAYIIMLIHFLQKRNLLPVLQEIYEGSERPSFIVDGWNAWYQSNLAVVSKHWKPSSSPTSLEYLWLDFFYYYTVEFNTDKEVVSIRQAAPLHKIDKGWQSAYMAIEDPFDLNHNLSGCLSLDKCRYILQCFAHVLKLHSNNENLARNDITQHMLMEPSNLRPPVNNSTRTCYQCNKPGHVSRDCKERPTNRTPMKSAAPVSQELPNLPSSFKYRDSTNPNRCYLQTDMSDNASYASIPLKALSGNINDFSIVPISMNVGSKSIVIPMLVDKAGRTYDLMNNMFKNGVQNFSSIPINAETVSIDVMDGPKRVIPEKPLLNNFNTVHLTPNNNNNQKKPFPKNFPTPLQNSRAPNEFFNQQFINKMAINNNQNFGPSPARLMQPPVNQRFPGDRYFDFSHPPGLHFDPQQGVPQSFPLYEPMNGRQGNPNQGGSRYHKGNK